MAKQRPTLGTFAQPTSRFVAPVQQQATPLNQQAIRDTLAFADQFSELSQSVVRLASMLKTEQNKEEFREGQDLVNSSRSNYANLVASGQINPDENPWFAVGAQTASGTIQGFQSRAEFQKEYDRLIAEDPERMRDNDFYDAYAASFVQNKRAQLGDSPYLVDSFFESFNPYVNQFGMKHAENVVKYRQNKIMEGITIKVDEVLETSVTERGWLDPTISAPYRDVINGMRVTLPDSDIQIPVAVPSLTDAEISELAAYGEGGISFEIERKAINFALDRVKQGLPLFQTDEGNIEDLQMFVDQRGQEMGMYRAANLSAATRLIKEMAEGSDPWRAEKILNGLRTGTGMLADNSEVKEMLVEAEADIAKNKFAITKAQEEALVFGQIAVAAASGEESKGLSYNLEYDNFLTALGKTGTFNTEERLKMIETFNTRFEQAVARRETADVAVGIKKSLSGLEGQISAHIARAKQNPSAFMDTVDWAATKANINSDLARMGIMSGTPEYNRAMVFVRRRMESYFNGIESQYLGVMNQQLEAAGLPTTDTMAITKDDKNVSVRKIKDDFNSRLVLNRIVASEHFEDATFLKDVYGFALNGISYDVERGVDDRLRHLILAYRTGREGFFSTESLFPADAPAKRRLRTFLDNVVGSMEMGATMDNAVRDAQQLVRFEANPLEMTNIPSSGSNLIEYQDALQAAFEYHGTLHQDSRSFVTSQFAHAYSRALKATNGNHQEALNVANEEIEKNTFSIRGAVLPGKLLTNRSAAYWEEVLIDLSKDFPQNMRGNITFAVVGMNNDGPVLGLRDGAGNAITNTYYTIPELTDASYAERIVRNLDERAKRSAGAFFEWFNRFSGGSKQ